MTEYEALAAEIGPEEAAAMCVHDWRLVTLRFGISQREHHKNVWFCTRCRLHERYEDKFGE